MLLLFETPHNFPNSFLSDGEPKNEENKKAEGEKIVDIIFVIGFRELQNLPDGVPEHGMCGVELIVHGLQELVLFLYLLSNVYGK